MDDEVKGAGNQYDYGMRIYDPRVSRFLSVDPLTNSYPWNSPYAFNEGNPINYIDLDGAETPIATAQSTRPATVPRINVTVSPDLLNGKSGGSVGGGTGTQLFTNGPTNSGLYTPQTRYLSQAEILAMVPPNCGAYVNPDGKSMTVTSPNSTWQVSLIKTEKPMSEFERNVARVLWENMKQVNAQNQRITTDPSSLTNEQLQESLDRITHGKGSQEDWLYWREIQVRMNNGKLPIAKQAEVVPQKQPVEKISFTQGSGDKAKKIEVELPVGYTKTKLRSHGQAVYSDGENWITPDQDGHNGGIWKMYDSEKNVGSGTRAGTFDKDLKKIGN